MKDKDQKKKDLEDLRKALEENKNFFVASSTPGGTTAS
jgi:hypothetical protein